MTVPRTEHQHRSDQAYNTLIKGEYTRGGANTIEDAVADLLADLIHLCQDYNLEMDDLLARAQRYVDQENQP